LLIDDIDGYTLLVEHVQRHIDRHVHGDLGAAAAGCLFLDCPEDVQRRGFDRANVPMAMAYRTRLHAGFEQARAQALSRHLEQTEWADAAELQACAIRLERLLQLALDGDVVPPVLHVDEVDHDESGEVAPPELSGDLHGGLEI